MGKLTLSQTNYISKVLKKFNMSSCKPVPTPLASHFRLSSHECPKSEEDKEDMSRVPYSSAVDSLMYAMGVKEAILLRGMVTELGLPRDVLVVYCDNQSAVYLTKKNKFHSKIKKIKVGHHFV
ncbi:hypothetical protein Tco_1467625 [Tanacetum coccineum]